MKKQTDWITFKLPAPFVDTIDQFIKVHKHEGFTTRSDVIKTSIREFIVKNNGISEATKILMDNTFISKNKTSKIEEPRNGKSEVEDGFPSSRNGEEKIHPSNVIDETILPLNN